MTEIKVEPEQQIIELTMMLDEVRARAWSLQEENAKLKADREHVGISLLHEAEEREWCDEYNAFVRRENRALSTPWLIEMECDDDDDE
jgi:regulator of replication initiation timing